MPHEDPTQPPELLNELADADRLVTDLDGRAWYCASMGSKKPGDTDAGWLVWDGKRLKPSEDGSIFRLARQTALNISQELTAEAEGMREMIESLRSDPGDTSERIKDLKRQVNRLLDRAKVLHTEKRIKTMVSIAKTDKRILIDAKELDADPDLLNVDNGVIHLPTAELRPHHPKWRCSKICPVAYNPDADTRHLDRVLHRGLMAKTEAGTWETDIDRVRFLQDACGSALFGDNRHQKFYLFVGNGGDGKGTFCEGLLEVLGSYGGKADSQSFVRQKLSNHAIRTDLMALEGVRCVIASELNRDDALDSATVKLLSGEDTLTGRKLYSDQHSFRSCSTLILQTNHYPRVDSNDHALWRRLVVIPWGPSLGSDERDPAVRRALLSEEGKTALLAWMVAGSKRVANLQSIPPTPSVTDATAAYRSDQNPLGDFLLRRVRFSSRIHARQTFVEQSILRQALEAYLNDTGQGSDRVAASLSGRRLGAALRDWGAFNGQKRIMGKNREVWYGCTLSEDCELFQTACQDTYLPTNAEHIAQISACGAVCVGLQADVPICTPISSNSNNFEKGIKKTSLEPTHLRIEDRTLPDLDSLSESEAF